MLYEDACLRVCLECGSLLTAINGGNAVCEIDRGRLSTAGI